MRQPRALKQDLAPLKLRCNHEIFSADGGWFRARWHFSFDEYNDPHNMGIGALRVFNHDTLAPGTVWPMHHHRDVEGITYVVAGVFEHADSLGNNGVLYPGGVQRMTLGSGAQHSERNHSPIREMQFIQMWVLPHRRGLAPSVEQRQYTDADRRNHLLQVLRPVGSSKDGVDVHQDVHMYVSLLENDIPLEYAFAPGRGGYLYLIQGHLQANDQSLSSGDAAYIPGDGLLHLSASHPSHLLLVDTPL